MKNKINILVLVYSFFRFILFVFSHYLSVKHDYFNPGNSIYQYYFFPLICSLELLISSMTISLISFLNKSFTISKMISCFIVFIDLLTASLIFIGFNLDCYNSYIYCFYGISFAFFLSDFVKEKSPK
jgi:hypothetical protein